MVPSLRRNEKSACNKPTSPGIQPLQTMYVEAIASMTTENPCKARVKLIPRCRPCGPTFSSSPSANRVLSLTYRTGDTKTGESRPARPGPTPGELVCNYFHSSVAERRGSLPRRTHALPLLRDCIPCPPQNQRGVGRPATTTILLSRHRQLPEARTRGFNSCKTTKIISSAKSIVDSCN